MLDLVRTQIAEQILGVKDGRRFLPLLATIFFMIFALNITGVIPLLNIGGTSVVGVPLLLALIAYVTFIVVGIRAQGVGGVPQEQPVPARGAEAAVRAGHADRVRLDVPHPAVLADHPSAGQPHRRAPAAGALLLGDGLLPRRGCWRARRSACSSSSRSSAGFAFTLFEILVAVLQAYIFSLLTAVYISGALHPEH